MQTSCLSGSNKIDRNCSKVTNLRNSKRKTSQGMSSWIMLAMWSSSKINAICLVGLARGSRIWQGRSQEGYRKGRSKVPALVSPPTTHLVVLFTNRYTADPKTRKRKSPPHTDIAPSPKRTRVGDSSLIINGDLEHFRSGSKDFSHLLRKEGQAYFDRTGYIFKLHKLDDSILFCRPRRFGKSLTVSMLEHFHGLQYADEHQSLYKVCNNILNYLDVRTYFSFNHSRVSMCKRVLTKEKQKMKNM